MKVALVSNIFNPCGPAAPGGLEVFNYYLATELERQGASVKLYASGDSTNIKSLVPIVKKSLLHSKNKQFMAVPWNYRKITVEEFAIYTELMQKLKDFNGVIHFSMVNFLPIYLAVKNGLSIVTTMHMPATNYHYQALVNLLDTREIKKVNFVGISKAQVKNFPHARFIVNNGVNTTEFRYQDNPKNSFIWIGRMIPEKGVDDAIKVAKLTGFKFEIAGAPNGGAEETFFNQKIKPNFGGNISYRGHLKGRDRIKFYNSRAMIFPMKWEEAFGLTIIEAMSCGTPVIAYNRGAVSEIIEDGVTGYVVEKDNVNGLVCAMKKINRMPEDKYQLMRQRCRETVEQKYSLTAMASRYLNLYKGLMKK